MNKTKLALIDFDGTLYDTIDADFEAYRDALRAFGCDLDEEYFHGCFGGYYKDFLKAPLGERYDELVEPVHDRKVRDYHLHFDRIRENTALIKLLETMSKDYYLVIVSTGSGKSMGEILDYFGRRELFDGIVDQKAVPKKKPAPDAFIYAMEKYGIAPKDTLVFEDSELGIAAAKAAGLQYFKVEKIVQF